MSLRVWLPLNGNLNNQGASGCNPVQSTAPTYVNGKIGKAMSTGAFYLPATEVAKFYNNNAMSWCFWIYPTGSGGNAILGQQNMAAGNNRMFTIFQYPNPVDLHLSWQGETQNNAVFLQTIISNAFTASTWNHCAITYNGATALIYVNGALVGSANGTSPRTNFSYDVPLPNSSIRQLCDLRIYDHVLSAKEVKEISKALIIHYPLDNQYELGKINKFSADVASGLVGPGSFTRTKLADERGYNYKLTRTGNGGNIWPNLGTTTFSFTVGKRYFYSVKVRCNKWTSGALRLRAARSSNDWVTNSVAVCSPSQADGEWHEYYTSQVINETYERSGTVPCNPILEFYCDNQNGDGTLYDMDFDLKDVQVIESDEYIPFIQNEYAGDAVVDTSGFKNNATKSGTITCTSDTPKYSKCFKFTSSSSSHIVIPAITVDMTNVTFSSWCKWTTFNSWSRVFDFGEKTSGTGYSFLVSNNSSSTLTVAGRGAGGASLPDTTIQAISLNTWYHIAITLQNTTCKVYVNGALVKTFTINQAFSTATPFNLNYLGRSNWSSDKYLDGQISDFRLYATALSADDIKELYQTSASITNNGTVMCLDFQED